MIVVFVYAECWWLLWCLVQVIVVNCLFMLIRVDRWLVKIANWLWYLFRNNDHQCLRRTIVHVVLINLVSYFLLYILVLITLNKSISLWKLCCHYWTGYPMLKSKLVSKQRDVGARGPNPNERAGGRISPHSVRRYHRRKTNCRKL